MSKKDSGNSLFDDFFDGFFDFNKDGRTSLDEEYVAYRSYEQWKNSFEKPSSASDIARNSGIGNISYSGASNAAPKNSSAEIETYKKLLARAAKFALRPERFSDRVGFEKAVIRAEKLKREEDLREYNRQKAEKEAAEKEAAEKEAAEKEAAEKEAASKLEPPKFSGYPNRRQELAAETIEEYHLGNEYYEEDLACCNFILENANSLIAANYLSHNDGFLYSQAVKENFELPVSLPSEDEERKCEFPEMIRKIAKRQQQLAIEVWEWCLNQFLPYAEHDPYCVREMTTAVIDVLYSFPSKFSSKLIRYLDAHPDFCEKLLKNSTEASDYDVLIARAIELKLFDTALALFKHILSLIGANGTKIITFTSDILANCKNYTELETVEHFHKSLFPYIRDIGIKSVQKKISKWEKEIAEYIEYIERSCDQYTYTRRNAWRKSVPDGRKYDLYPRDYDTESDYLQALHEEKYGWRKYVNHLNCYGLIPEDFETEEEFDAAYEILHQEAEEANYRERIRADLEADTPDAEMPSEETFSTETPVAETLAAKNADADDKTIYTYCGVRFGAASRIYYYRTDDLTLKPGDNVLVPSGDTETIGKVVSAGQFFRISAPYPPEKTKFIINKIEN